MKQNKDGIMRKAKSIDKKIMWAYFSKEGDVQVRTLSYTKDETRRHISRGESVTYKDYERNGFFLQKVVLDVQPILKIREFPVVGKE